LLPWQVRWVSLRENLDGLAIDDDAVPLNRHDSVETACDGVIFEKVG
jgi:hypothetical protein